MPSSEHAESHNLFVCVESIIKKLYIFQKDAKTEQEKAGCVATPPPLKSEVVDQRGVDDLLKFINGCEEEEEEEEAGKMSSSKAAKRARQKQRKVSASGLLLEGQWDMRGGAVGHEGGGGV